MSYFFLLTTTFATKLPVRLKKALAEICKRYGLKQSFVVEQALREKLEDIVDAHDLEEARNSSSGFESWDKVEATLRKDGKP